MNILIAEDEALVAHDIAAILENVGHTIAGIVDTAEDVLAVAEAARPDIVLLDIHLRGEHDGISIGQILRERFQLPFVYLTAHADRHTVQRAATTGPFGYVIKPFDEQALLSTLEVALHKHQLEQQLKASEQALQQANRELRASVAALEQRTTEVVALSALGGALLRCTSVEECYAVIVETGRHLFADADGVLYIQRTNQAAMEAVARWGASAASYPSLQPGGCWALRYGRVMLKEAEAHCCTSVFAPLDTLHQTICVPLSGEEGVCGVLHMRLPQSGDPLLAAAATAACSRLAVALAEQAALGLANIRMREALREQAAHDALTGLYNRRYLEEILAQEQSRAARSNHPIGLIFLDIDHFKQINDTWGHAAGDMVLRALSRLLQTVVRTEDIVCRYGGEEFVLVLPSAPEAATFTRAEAIRQQVQAMRVFYDQQLLPPISISAGIVVITDQSSDVADALRRADAALYQAKRAGRNCIRVAHPALAVTQTVEEA
jgi:diguanylate cyclase (GGDEF)-like protein